MSAGRNSLIYIAFSILQKAISFILLPVLTYYLSKDDMGKITLLTAIVPIMALYCGLVLYGSGTAFTYRYDDKTKVAQLWGNINLFTNIFGVIFVGLMYFSYSFIQKTFLEGLTQSDFNLILGVVFFTSIYNQYQSYLQALKKVRIFTANAIVFTIINVFLVITCVVGLRLGYHGYFYAMFITNLIFYIYTMYHGVKNFNFKIDTKILKDCLKYSIPLLPHLTFAISLSYIDRIFVNKYMGTAEVGVYGIGCQFALIFSLVINGFTQSYSPFSFEMLKQKNYKAITQFCYKTLVTFSCIMIIVSILSYDIFYVLINHKFITGWVVLPFFACAYMFQLGYIFFVTILFYSKPQLVNIVTLISSSLNIILNIYLTKYYGIIGATICTLISYFVSMVVVYLISIKILKIGFDIIKLMIYQFVVVCICMVAYWVSGIVNVFTRVSIETACILLGCMICLLLSNLLFKFQISDLTLNLKFRKS